MTALILCHSQLALQFGVLLHQGGRVNTSFHYFGVPFDTLDLA